MSRPTTPGPSTPPSAVDEHAIREGVARLPLRRKIALLSGAAQFELVEAPEIGLDSLVLSDGPTGVRGPVVVGGRQSCLLPNATLLAQSWDPALLARAGNILADEAVHQRTQSCIASLALAGCALQRVDRDHQLEALRHASGLYSRRAPV